MSRYFFIFFSLILFGSAGNVLAQANAVATSVTETVTPANATEKNDPEVFSMVEVMPEFPGGMAALMRYIQANVKYPKHEMENNIQGKVYIKFIVEKDGSVSKAEVIKGIPGGSNLDNEALHVVREMPKWNPGYLEGKPVRVNFNIPINFKLEDPKPEKK